MCMIHSDSRIIHMIKLGVCTEVWTKKVWMVSFPFSDIVYEVSQEVNVCIREPLNVELILSFCPLFSWFSFCSRASKHSSLGVFDKGIYSMYIFSYFCFILKYFICVAQVN